MSAEVIQFTTRQILTPKDKRQEEENNEYLFLKTDDYGEDFRLGRNLALQLIEKR